MTNNKPKIRIATDQKAIHTHLIADPNVLALYTCILFLDFDGVLHGFSNGHRGLFQHIEKIEQLLIDHPNVCVSFSTSWRFSHSMEQLLDYFRADLHHRFVGANPTVQEKWPPYVTHERYKECIRFMEENNWTGSWAAVDDAKDLFPLNCENLIVTEGNLGLSDDDVINLIEHLKRTSANIF